MEPNQHQVRRLAFIRYLLETAVRQSGAPAPLKCASILMMHDAVELWLHLASEHLNVGANIKKLQFMDYWELLRPKLEPRELSHQKSMSTLNGARVAMKHYGTFPSNADIEKFRADTISFFRENTPVVFGVHLDEVSLVDYVNPETSRALLKDAQAALERGETLGALGKVAVAYAEMIRDVEEVRQGSSRRSPLFFGRPFTFYNTSDFGLKASNPEQRKLGEFLNRTKESIESMQEAMKVLALGVDFRKYFRFKRLTAPVRRYAGGRVRIILSAREAAPTDDDVLFCLDFVIESALALTEFDDAMIQKN